MPDDKMIDESCGYTGQRYALTRVYVIGDDRVRVRIERDFYPFQSFAIAAVLNSQRTWTGLASLDPSTWLRSTPDRDDFRPSPSRGDIVQSLGILADTLAEKAATILGIAI